jgi:diguanylate cyclase (GGDEF)-like protein
VIDGATSATIESAASAYWALLKRVALFAAGVDIGFLLLYGALGAMALALVNLVSVAIYLVAWWLLVRRRNEWAIGLMWFEVLTHATAGSLLLGWQADFHYFLLLIVPAIVVGAPPRRAIPLVLLLFACYAALYLACRLWAPLSPLPPMHLEVARWFNIVMVFGMLFGMSAFYRQRVRGAERRLKELARVDALTRLANRTHFQERSAGELARARRDGLPVTLMLADVDHFKRVNDGHGHQAGDRVLAEVARVIAGALREPDLLARWGGEEFVALLTSADPAEARRVAERVRRAVETHAVTIDGQPLAVTLSFGLAGVTDGDLNASMRHADRALYASKRSGRNRVTHADDVPEPPEPPVPADNGGGLATGSAAQQRTERAVAGLDRGAPPLAA